MRHSIRSLRYALEGLLHALRYERNLRLFFICYALALLAGWYVTLAVGEWIALVISGGVFIAVELLNTALERLVDVCDELRQPAAFHRGLKAAKDVGSAAALVSLFVVIVTVVMTFSDRF